MHGMVEAALGKIEPKVAGGASISDDYQLIAQSYNTLYRLAWATVGDVIINNCNTYTYIDNSLDVKFTSGGGESYSEAEGDSKSTDIKRGNQTDQVEVVGNQVSTTLNDGEVTSSETTTGKVTTEEILRGGSSSTTVRLRTANEYSLDLANSVVGSVKIGPAEKLDVAIGGEISLNVLGSARIHTDLVATYDNRIILTGAQKFTCEVQTQKLEVVVPDAMEVKIKEFAASLDSKYVGVNQFDAKVKLMDNAVLETNARVTLAESSVQGTENALTRVTNVVNQNANLLRSTTTALSESKAFVTKDVRAFANNVKAGIHNIS